MKIYKVGGCVRDKIMGKEPSDIDYVVVGGTREKLIQLGLTPINKNIPVFKDSNNDEYALARKEIKTGAGYNGFQFTIEDVSLCEDLNRRDLTINSMAEDSEGNIIDPFNGKKDINQKILRATNPKTFIEDPLRVLRVARFSASFPDFTISDDTKALMKKMCASEDYKNLTPERVYKELLKVLLSEKPSNFFEVLKDVGGLKEYFEDIYNLIDVPQNPKYHPEGCAYTHVMMVIDQAREICNAKGFNEEKTLRIVFAAFAHDFGKGITPNHILPAHHNHEEEGVPLVINFCEKYKVHKKIALFAQVMTRQHIRVHRASEMRSSKIIKLLKEIGAYKNPEIVNDLEICCAADEAGKNKAFKINTFLSEFLKVTSKISAQDVDSKIKGKAIGEEIHKLRIQRGELFKKEFTEVEK